MAKRRREPDSDGTTTETAEHNTVFVDTSLDTRLAMLVFKSDTVSEFKKKIVLEHMQCFPKIEIQIHSLKVKRRASFYHLPESMHVWSAFHGAKGNWFLSVDASSTPTSHLNQNSSELGLAKCTIDDSCRGLSSDINRIPQIIPISLPEMIPGFTVENSLEKTADIQNSNFPGEKRTETESPAKKKRKTKHTKEDLCHNLDSKDTDASFHASVTDTVMPGIVDCGKSTVDAVKGVNVCEQQEKPTRFDAFVGTTVPAVGKKSNLGSDDRKKDTVLESKIPENLMANPKEYELDQDVQADQSGAVSVKAPDISVGSMDAQETSLNIQDNENMKSETTSLGKKKKKKTKSNKLDNNNIEKPGLLQPSRGDTVVSEKREPDEENQHSAGNGHADIPLVEKEKDSENTDNTDKKAKKKRKKKMLTTADVQEDLPIKNQKNGTGENSISFVNSEPEGIHEASSKVPSRQSEEKLEEKHEIAVKTDDPARTTEDEVEGINFKEYFVPCEEKKANQSSMEMKSLKKVKTNGLPSVSISTEVQSSSKLSADHESKNKSRVRKDSGKRQRDSAHNSDSSRRSSRVPENGVKDSSTSEMPETNLRKPKEIIAESSILKKKNASLVKSSFEKFPGKSGNKRSLFSLNVTNRMEFKTPKKKSLLTKQGALFQDISGESSGDENGTAHSSGSTRSPSDSSSMSDHSMGESDLSQDSTRKGSSVAQGQFTGGKGTSKLDLLDSEEMTMDMILRSSKRFKKAKLLASQNEANQNESQPIEFVPDSLPV
ncbi:hypothetical protein PHJA_002699000 [Phtheirospermum japonicum]|uniref:Uncharacterized protein n=1 Tax=Phtheirospermum japonicum TaxID=374723 RepID=A0A830D6S6_9LAMI|nr:hypothetical protein PHJA_002699000 [Phtheirospermum japonicum]